MPMDLSKEVHQVLLNELEGATFPLPDKEVSLRALILAFMADYGQVNDRPNAVDGLRTSTVWLLLIFMGLEERFGIEIKDEEAIRVKTFGDLVALVEGKLTIPG